MENKYAQLLLDEQIFLLTTAKNKTNLNWTKFAEKLGVKKALIFAYTKGTKMPFSLFKLLCETAELNATNFKFGVIILNNQPREVTIPISISADLSEFVGVLAGDGHVSCLKFQIDICGHHLQDKEYIEYHVEKLFHILFKTIPLRGNRPGVVYRRIHSKQVVNYLVKTFNIPVGKKKGKLRIPLVIFENKLFLAAYIRGLFDTDGSIYRHHKNSVALDITSLSPDFRIDVKNALADLGFHAVINGKNIQMYRQKEIHEFFKVIKPANQKHLKKYCFFNINGFLPKSTEFFNQTNINTI